jgi:hypothetical protein
MHTERQAGRPDARLGEPGAQSSSRGLECGRSGAGRGRGSPTRPRFKCTRLKTKSLVWFWHASPGAVGPTAAAEAECKADQYWCCLPPPGNPSRAADSCFINLLQGRRQVLNPTLECAIVGFRDDDIYVAGIFRRSAPGAAARDRRRGTRRSLLPSVAIAPPPGRGFSPPPFPCSHTRAVFPAAHCRLNPFGMVRLLLSCAPRGAWSTFAARGVSFSHSPKMSSGADLVAGVGMMLEPGARH